jgi:hypothetical protein
MRITEALKIGFALPVYQISNIVASTRGEGGWHVRIAIVLAFLPILVTTTVCWLAAWVTVLWLLSQLI